MIKAFVGNIIDFFYPLFKNFIDKQTFSYLACGGFNTSLDIFLYFIAYNYILHQQPIHIWVLDISPYICAFFISFVITFPLGFILSSSIVFTNSALRRRIQLFRYLILVCINILLNYTFIKLFVEYFHVFPTIAKIYTTIIVVVFSYIVQRNFTFRQATQQETTI
jgi:putative flippase GtrA